MHFGRAIGTACSSFAITNIDDIFVLVTFFAEASTGQSDLTPLKIAIGQYVGFSIIVSISMIGFGLALVLPAEPIGFLGLLPMLLGAWKLLDFLFPDKEEEDPIEREQEEVKKSNFAGLKGIFTVALITIMNGGDNIGTYVPLFSQAKGAEVAVYVVVYYILLGIWILAAYMIMKQRHILKVAQKYAHFVIPFLYVGLGIFITVKSECYPWSIERINESVSTQPGTTIMAVVTTFLILACIGIMVWFKWRARATKHTLDAQGAEQDADVMTGGNSAQQTLGSDTARRLCDDTMSKV